MLHARATPTGFARLLAISQCWQLSDLPDSRPDQIQVSPKESAMFLPGHQIFSSQAAVLSLQGQDQTCLQEIHTQEVTHNYVDNFFSLSCCSSYCSRNDIAQKFDQALQGHPLDCLALLTHKVWVFLNSIISLLTSQRLQQAPLLLTMTRHNFMSP